MPGIFNPPPLWCQVVDNLPGSSHHIVGLQQFPGSGREGSRIFRAWWRRCHQIKISWGKVFPVLPTSNVCHHIGFPLCIPVHTHHMVSEGLEGFADASCSGEKIKCPFLLPFSALGFLEFRYPWGSDARVFLLLVGIFKIGCLWMWDANLLSIIQMLPDVVCPLFL